MERLTGRREEQGVTLVELMIVVAILGMVVAGMYNMFTFQQKSYTVQDNVAVMQQNVRVGLEYMVKEIRMAGYIPESIPGATGSTDVPGEESADTDAPIPTADGVNESIEEATANAITFQADIDDDGITEAVRYVVTYNAGINSTDLTREVWEWNGTSWDADEDGDGIADPAQTIAENIDNIVFSYDLLADSHGLADSIDNDGNDGADEPGELMAWNFTANGALTNVRRGLIRKVHINMVARSPVQDSAYVHPQQGDHFRRRILSSNICLRNMK